MENQHDSEPAIDPVAPYAFRLFTYGQLELRTDDWKASGTPIDRHPFTGLDSVSPLPRPDANAVCSIPSTFPRLERGFQYDESLLRVAEKHEIQPSTLHGFVTLPRVIAVVQTLLVELDNPVVSGAVVRPSNEFLLEHCGKFILRYTPSQHRHIFCTIGDEKNPVPVRAWCVCAMKLFVIHEKAGLAWNFGKGRVRATLEALFDIVDLFMEKVESARLMGSLPMQPETWLEVAGRDIWIHEVSPCLRTSSPSALPILPSPPTTTQPAEEARQDPKE